MDPPLYLRWSNAPGGLLPCIVQNYYTGSVLMLAWMNEDSLNETRKSGLVTFFSRSRNCLWQKGETSGNAIKVCAITPDCDGDTILIQGIPSGPACHRSTSSCFSMPGEIGSWFLDELLQTIKQRSENTLADQSSYTRSLLQSGVKGCSAKLMEEAAELFAAARGEGDDRVTEEAADLLYHALVLLLQRGVDFTQVMQALKKRRKANIGSF